jgi:type III secretion protein Q
MFDLDDFTAAPPVHVDPPGPGTPRALDLVGASLTIEQMRLSRRIGSGCQTALAGLGDDAALALQLVPQGQALASDWSDPVRMTGAFGSLEFAQGARLLRGITGVDIGAERGTGAERWTWLQAALIGRLGGTPLAGVEQLAFGGLHDAGALTVLRVTLQTGQHAFSTTARGSASAWLGFLSGAQWVRKRRSVAEFADLLSQITVRIARHTMPAKVAGTLRAGDIILPSSPNFMCNGEGIIRWGGLTARVCYKAPCALTIIALEGNVEQNEQYEHDEQNEHDEHDEHDEQNEHDIDIDMPVEHDPDAAPATIAAAQQADTTTLDTTTLDKVAVTLDFELGKARMSFGELRTLGVGAVVLLDGGSTASLAIVSGGRTLGYGEAVDVNGQLGIRVTQWGQGQ